MIAAAQRGEAGLVPITVPAQWPTLPWLAATGVLLGAAAGLVHPAATGPRGAASRRARLGRRPPARRGAVVIRFEGVGRALRRQSRARCCATSTSRSTRASWPWWSARPAAARRTLLRCVNGLVPHFSGGTLSGRVLVDGRDTRTHRPRDLADVVGIVGQNPTAAFVTDTVEEELAYGLETLGSARRRDAQAGRGDARPDGSGGPARPRPADAVRRAGPAGGDRSGARRAPPHPGAGRADLGAGSRCGRGGAGRADPVGARPRADRAAGRAPAGAGGPVRRPGGHRGRRVGQRRRPAPRDGDLAGGAAGGRARAAGRLGAAAAVGPRGPPARGTVAPQAR